jgi:hypothetical protein
MGEQEQAALVVTVEGDIIAVKRPGTPFAVAYKRQRDEPGLRLYFSWVEPNTITPVIAEFRSAAWQAACEKARDLGWIA